ncbi:MAG: MarR family transcriptional regulator [Candidatus Omnitrophica bacterium CG11_big_fil_rev_8_21_14_0_20_45_26]|uniref:MarR family transcriptional regulator n=1 Tax=Candidatus Abzuiibacterium crystallinum TaxID=1974748 RepID=A0A2H0LMJ7_9BACT|nr:MAG: MarR family transcriptional regulator [Candidatus Omnitrophica bacterium CG11_big_fil_rev_8_21_14_0_20_45_26]PIW65191.1 MAG: MarR family transcriptional regulator [Candidatus Omnitrophica bacterium CG12_big_fil_rev_8_21_14_0_65_45_16]
MATKTKSETKSTCACFNLRMAARAITQAYDEALRHTGLRATQLALLAPCRQLGSVTICELARTIVTDRTTLTRNVQILVRQGYLKVTKGEDGREKLVSVTAKGESALEKAYPVWCRIQNKFVSQLGKERFERLLEDLSKAVAIIQS